MEEYLLEKMQEAHRVLRHDFMNALQVINGFYQLNQPEKSKIYTMNTIEAIKKFIPLGRIRLPRLQCLFTICLSMHNSNQGACTIDVEQGDDSWNLEDDRELTRLAMGLMFSLEQYIINGQLCCRVLVSPRPHKLITIYLEGNPEVKVELKTSLFGMEDPRPFYMRVQENPEGFQITVGKETQDFNGDGHSNKVKLSLQS